LSLVLDSSATLARIFEDETNRTIVALFDRVAAEGAIVPTIWRLEVANTLALAVRKNRIEKAFRTAALADLDAADITTDTDTEKHVWAETLILSDKHRLTIYDATYLELANRRSLPLATLDRDLAKAARAIGISVLGLSS
jgi:predicted nucleic acid-binding protein